jgi:hypothetical protein
MSHNAEGRGADGVDAIAQWDDDADDDSECCSTVH